MELTRLTGKTSFFFIGLKGTSKYRCIETVYKGWEFSLLSQFKMSYSMCGLCLKDLEVIKPASGISYIRCVDWKLCPFFYREDDIHAYQQYIQDRVIPDYITSEGGQFPYCRHMDVTYIKSFKITEQSILTLFYLQKKERNVQTNNLLMTKAREHLQYTTRRKTSHRMKTNPHTNQDLSCKDNVPFQTLGFTEH